MVSTDTCGVACDKECRLRFAIITSTLFIVHQACCVRKKSVLEDSNGNGISLTPTKVERAQVARLSPTYRDYLGAHYQDWAFLMVFTQIYDN